MCQWPKTIKSRSWIVSCLYVHRCLINIFLGVTFFRSDTTSSIHFWAPEGSREPCKIIFTSPSNPVSFFKILGPLAFLPTDCKARTWASSTCRLQILSDFVHILEHLNCRFYKRFRNSLPAKLSNEYFDCCLWGQRIYLLSREFSRAKHMFNRFWRTIRKIHWPEYFFFTAKEISPMPAWG